VTILLIGNVVGMCGDNVADVRFRVWRETALEIEFRDILYLSELLNVIWEVLNDSRPISSSGAACLVTWTYDTLSM